LVVSGEQQTTSTFARIIDGTEYPPSAINPSVGWSLAAGGRRQEVSPDGRHAEPDIASGGSQPSFNPPTATLLGFHAQPPEFTNTTGAALVLHAINCLQNQRARRRGHRASMLSSGVARSGGNSRCIRELNLRPLTDDIVVKLPNCPTLIFLL